MRKTLSCVQEKNFSPKEISISGMKETIIFWYLFQSQQYQTQYSGSTQDGLHVNTDPRMLASQQFKSPSSPTR